MCILGFQIVVDARPRSRELCAAQRMAMQARTGRPSKAPQLTPAPILAVWVVLLCCVVIGDGSCVLVTGGAPATQLSL